MATKAGPTFVMLGNCEIIERSPEKLVLRKRQVSSVRWTMGAIFGLALVGAAAIVFQWVEVSPAGASAVILLTCLAVAAAIWLTFELPRMHLITFDRVKGELVFSFRRRITRRIPLSQVRSVEVRHQRTWSRERGEDNEWMLYLALTDGVMELLDNSNSAEDMRRLAGEIDAVIGSKT